MTFIEYLDRAVEYWPIATIVAMAAGFVLALIHDEAPRFWRDES